MAIEHQTNPKPLGTKLDSGTIYNRAEVFLDLSIVQEPFSVAPCQTLISQFATFSSLCDLRLGVVRRGGLAQLERARVQLVHRLVQVHLPRRLPDAHDEQPRGHGVERARVAHLHAEGR
jgi:hypothetical protein